MTPPIAKTFTRDELIDRARQFTRENWTATECDGTRSIPIEYREKHDRELTAIACFILNLFDGETK
jgi:hypothetical protein